MKKESMIDLVVMYEALEKVDDVQNILIGTSYVLGSKDGLFGVFTRVFDIIKRECNQSLVNRELDAEDNEYYKILTSNTTIEQKVDALM